MSKKYACEKTKWKERCGKSGGGMQVATQRSQTSSG